MAKYDKVPRKKKKALKKAAGLQGQKTAKKEVVTLANKEAQKKKRDAATLRRYNANKEYLKSLNIPTDIISKSTSIKETKKRAENYLAEKAKKDAANARQYKQANLVARKINRLLDAGFTQEEAQKIVGSFWRPKSDKEIDRIIYEKQNPINDHVKVTTRDYLYVGFAETNDAMDFQLFKTFSVEEMEDRIKSRLHECEVNPDGSDAMSGVFVVEYGSLEMMKAVAEDYYSRGYNFAMRNGKVKLDHNRYFKLTLNNTYSLHNFLQLVCTVLCNCKNDMAAHYFNEFKYYCKDNGLPFLDNI